ncbi:MAG TPA: HPP family protein [Microbacteriaceae bacterium]|nr:HPP family protein [Microbacteriaceae bacterium]
MSSADEKARRNQIIIGLVMGVIVGVVISWLTQFWLWLAAGIVLGFVTGVLLKPPQQK